MKGYDEITTAEQFAVIGGKDSDVAKFMELLGYGLGMIVRMIKNMRKGKPNAEQTFSTVYLM